MSEEVKQLFKTAAAPPSPEPGGALDSGMRSLVRSLRFAFLALVALIVGTMVYFIAFGGYVVVPAQSAVIVLRFGAYAETCTHGAHWFLPYPVNRFIWIPVTPQTIRVEYLAVPAADGATVPLLVSGVDRYQLTGDANIVHTAWSFTYLITDPKRYYEKCLTPTDPSQPDDLVPFGTTPATGRGPQTLLKSLLDEAVTVVSAEMPIDDILGNRGEYRDRVFERFAKAVTQMNLGIEIDNLLPPSLVEPPLQTREAFQQATAAATTSNSYVDDANSYAIKLLGESRSSAAQTMAEAESYKRQAVEQLRSESVYFQSILAEYEKSSSSTLVALYNTALGEALSSVRDKYVLGGRSGRGKQLRIKLNPELLRQNRPTAAPGTAPASGASAPAQPPAAGK